jgi:hypothetical protein
VVQEVEVDLVCAERSQADVAVHAEGGRAAVNGEVIAVAPVSALRRDQWPLVGDAAQGVRHSICRW